MIVLINEFVETAAATDVEAKADAVVRTAFQHAGCDKIAAGDVIVRPDIRKKAPSGAC